MPMNKDIVQMATTLKGGFEAVLSTWNDAKKSPLKNHPLGVLVRTKLPSLIYSIGDVSESQYLVQGSVGQGNWATVPWLCVFDREITKSAQSGFYAVYLFDSKARGVYLSLNMGWTQFEKKYGIKEGRKVIRKTAADCRELLQGEYVEQSTSAIDLSDKANLAIGYELGNICSQHYAKDCVREDSGMTHDLQAMLKLYVVLKKELGTKNILSKIKERHKKKYIEDNAKDAAFQQEIGEAPPIQLPAGPIPSKKPSSSKGSVRWVRDPRIARGVLEEKNYVCEVADSHRTFISAATKKPYVEAHHLIPIAYQDDFKNSLDVPENILVLCPLCHRQFHHAITERRDLLLEEFYKRQIGLLEERGLHLSQAKLKEYY